MIQTAGSTKALALPRRALMLSALFASSTLSRAFAAAAITGVPPSHRIEFEVLRNGSKIGTHTLSFAVEPDHMVVTIAIRIAVSVGPIVVYRYEMDGEEVWQDGRFTTLDTTTNDNGTHHKVAIRRMADGLEVKSSGFPDSIAAPRAAPLTHWSAAALSGPLLSPQDGQAIQGTISPLGLVTLKQPDGRTIQATAFDLKVRTPTEDWYDANQIWVGLRAMIRDGSTMEYQRQA